MPDFTVRRLLPPDVHHFSELICLFKDVFEMESLALPDQEYLLKQLANDDFLVFVASKENKVAGGLTAYILWQYHTRLPLAYIYDLAVETGSQRQGIGKSLISAFLTYCKKTGVEEVYVQADPEDDHAIKFYRSTLAKEEQAVHFTYLLK